MGNTSLAAVMVAFGALSINAAVACVPEDCAVDTSSVHEAKVLVPIGGMTVPHVVMDFDALPVGPTSVAAINGQFPGSVLSNIAVTTRNGVGGYNFQAGSGNGLQAIDAVGNLGIISNANGAFQEIEEMSFHLAVPVTEFGFGIGDWSGPFNVNVYNGAALVSSLQVSTTTGGTAGSPGSEHYIQETTPFDRVEITALPDNPAANWLVHFIAVPGGAAAPVPALSLGGLILLGLAVLGMVSYRRRRRC